MQEGGRRALARFSVCPNNLELAGIDRRSRRKGPLGEIHEIVREIVALETDRAAAGIIQLDPWVAVAGIVRDTGLVYCLDLIQPDHRIRSQ